MISSSWIGLVPAPSRFEGLVLQWAQDERGWVALVVYVQPLPGGDVTVQQWVPSQALQPVQVAGC